jgi:hypothetical protein
MTTRIANARPRSRRNVKPAANGKPTELPNGLHERVLTDDDIRVVAYHKWMGAGCPPGDGVAFWLDAEHQLRNGFAKPA